MVCRVITRMPGRKKAWSFLSILIGALTTARAMAHEDQAEAVTKAALSSVLALARTG